MIPYEDFLKSKVTLAENSGFDVTDDEINPALKPHNRLMVKWMVAGGRRACFASFGLHKTVTQLEAVRLVLAKKGGRGLIVCPLGVRQEFIRDALNILGWDNPPKFIRSIDEADETGIYLTNYETIREGKLDPRLFTVVSLDEASILRGSGGSKTFREFMAYLTGDAGPNGDRRGVNVVDYIFIATATPAPNDYIEMLCYAAILRIMDISQAKTRFFKRDSTKADVLTLHEHKEVEFWLWVASWGLFVNKPSDLTGNPADDEGYLMPPLDVRWHEIPSDHSKAGAEKNGQYKMYAETAIGLQGASKEKRISLQARVNKMLELREEDLSAHRIIWHDLEPERDLIEKSLPVAAYGHWLEYKDGNEKGLELYERHYSCYQYADGRDRKLFVGPGFKTVLINREQNALFVWRKFFDKSGQVGINCAVFRNEGIILSSTLIKEAVEIIGLKYPGARLYTYVNENSIKSTNPGCCFKKAGWKKSGYTKGGLLILESFAPAENAIEQKLACKTIYGKQKLDERETIITEFSNGSLQELAGKPSMIGSGTNLQKYCAWSIYLGIGWKFNDFIQSLHRTLRFGQVSETVRADMIYTEAERKVRKDLERKWAQHNKMVNKMIEINKKYGLSQAAMAQLLTRKMGVERVEIKGEKYRIVNNDNVLELPRIETNSIGLILTSIPFATQYEYSPNYADYGHSENTGEFFRQMDYSTPEALRVLMPGRIAAIHVKDRIIPGGLTGLGFQTVYPFHLDVIEHYITCPDCRLRIATAKSKGELFQPCTHRFEYIGMKTIVTDVVRENAQTYRLGWTEQCKDGSKMGVGMPEYLLLFRKPPSDTSNAYADIPVLKEKPLQQLADGTTRQFIHKTKEPIVPGTGYSRARWQFDAHGFTRSSGDRLMSSAELARLEPDAIFKLFRDYSLKNVWDFEQIVYIGETLEAMGKLPPGFMLLQPQSWTDEVWSDVTRMLTLNMSQWSQGKEMHLCPMQFDTADRVILQMSNPGDKVLDYFGGLMTVPVRAIKHGRYGIGIELNTEYFTDGAHYCKAEEHKASIPTLFDVLEAENVEIPGFKNGVTDDMVNQVIDQINMEGAA